MKKFLIVQKGDLLGFISSNLKSSTWGIISSSEKNSLIDSLKEDYSNISISFPRDINDDLSLREQVAYCKINRKLNERIYLNLKLKSRERE